ncbi:hypothetical protein [Caproiciproducens sp.]
MRLAAATSVVAIATATAIIVSTAAAQKDNDKDDNPTAAATTASTKEIVVTHNCLPPFGLQYIILHRNKTCYKFFFWGLTQKSGFFNLLFMMN